MGALGRMQQETTISLIRRLPPEAAELFSACLGWLNPLPAAAEELPGKLIFALQQAKYIRDRTGEERQDVAQLAALQSAVQVAIAGSSKQAEA